jgi:N-acetylmuramoyl-L-alanine amidase
MAINPKFIQARSHGGALSGPRLLVVHDMEAPLARGYALSIANWFHTTADTSPHYCVDPGTIVQTLHTYTVAYHVGPKGNGFTLGYEQTGYARFTRAQWTTADGLSQMRLLAAMIAEDAKFYKVPIRWATDAQIRAAAAGGAPQGLCRHMDISRVLGGTTHTDPGDAYPRDLLLKAIQTAATGKPAVPTPAKPAPAPAPVLTATVVSGRVPVLKAGMKDPIKFGVGNYISRMQSLLGTPKTGVYDAALIAKVKSENARLLKRAVDGRTIDGVFWDRVYGLV